MTPRQKRLVDGVQLCRNVARQIEIDFPKSALNDPMLPKVRREIIAIRQADVALMELVCATAMAIAEDPEGYAVLVTLRAKKRWAFDSMVCLAKQELAQVDTAKGAAA
jgi:hypothetical protein